MADKFISLRAYAKRRGVSPMAVSAAIRDSRLKASVVRDAYGQPKIGDPDLADVEWERNTDASKRPPPRADAAPALEVPPGAKVVIKRETPGPQEPEGNVTATERLKSAQADLAELKFSEAAGEVVPVAEVKREWADLLSSVRTKLLGIPNRLKQAIPTLTVADIAKVEALVRESLEDLVTAEGS